MLITIVDCDQETFTEEHEITARDGLELRRSQARTEQEVIAAAEGAEGILVQYAPITAQVMDALPDLRAIGRYGVGVDTVDVEAATARGIAVCNVVDYGTEDVSDHAIALALTCARGTARFDRRIRSGEHDLAPVKPLHRLSTRTVGILGLGRIGRATGAKARALGCRVLGSDPTIEPGTTTEEGIETVDQDTLLANSHILSLHVPLIPATHHLITTTTLARMRPGAILVNTCRGGVVDTDALVQALASGHLQSAGLDVFEEEPLPADSPLLDLDNVVLTPHASWYSEESYSELKRRVTEAVSAVVRGQHPRDILNPEVLEGSGE